MHRLILTCGITAIVLAALLSEAQASPASLPLMESLGGHKLPATWDSQWWQLLLQWLGGSWNPTPKGSVPIPGTLALFGAGFGALVWWRERKSRQ